jgi:hypothetical protein
MVMDVNDYTDYYKIYDLRKLKKNDTDTGISQSDFLEKVAIWFPDWTYHSDTDTFTFPLYMCETRTYITCTVPDEQYQRLAYSLRYLRGI